VSAQRDAEYADFVSARLASLRRVAYLLCQDWHRADDLVQAAIMRLYVHWGRARAVDDTDAYARTILVRVFLGEQRSSWQRRVTLPGQMPDLAAAAPDHAAALDVRTALAALPPRQRTTLVLRFYCDLSVAETADALGVRARRPGRTVGSAEPYGAGRDRRRRPLRRGRHARDTVSGPAHKRVPRVAVRQSSAARREPVGVLWAVPGTPRRGDVVPEPDERPR